MATYEVAFEGNRSNPSLRDMQRHTYLDIDDDPLLDDLVYDNEVISKLLSDDVVIDLTVDTEVEENVEQVVEEAEAIVRESTELPLFVSIMTAQNSGHEIMNSASSHEPGPYERWAHITPPPGKGQPLRRERPRLPRHDIPSPNPRESRYNSWRRPETTQNDEVVIDIREKEPVVELPSSAPHLERRPRGYSEAHQEEPKPKKGFLRRVVNRIQDAIYDRQKVEKLPRPDRRRKVMGAIGAVAVVGLVAGAAYLNTSSSDQANATNDALNSRVAVATAVHPEVPITPMTTMQKMNAQNMSKWTDEQKAAFTDLMNWINANPGMDFGEALQNFYK